MSQCRCSEISKCVEDLTTLNEMLNTLAGEDSTIQSLKDDLLSASKSINGVYTSVNMIPSQMIMGLLGNDWSTVSSSMEGKINGKITEIENLKSNYEIEDQDYHENV